MIAILLVPVLAALPVFVLGYRIGGHRGTVTSDRADAMTALWDYQRQLNDSGREIDALVTGNGDALSETSRDDLYEARERAYRHAHRVSPFARWVVVSPSLPDVTDPAMDLVDVAHAYLTMAESLSSGLLAPARTRRTGRTTPAVSSAA